MAKLRTRYNVIQYSVESDTTQISMASYFIPDLQQQF